MAVAQTPNMAAPCMPSSLKDLYEMLRPVDLIISLKSSYSASDCSGMTEYFLDFGLMVDAVDAVDTLRLVLREDTRDEAVADVEAERLEMRCFTPSLATKADVVRVMRVFDDIVCVAPAADDCLRDKRLLPLPCSAELVFEDSLRERRSSARLPLLSSDGGFACDSELEDERYIAML